MVELWKWIPGWERIYQVSSAGKVRSFTRTLKPDVDDRGYSRVTLCRSSPEKHSAKVYVHRLVLLAFRGNPPAGKPFALHGNDNPRDNRLENLRWGSRLENSQDAIRNGGQVRGARSPSAKLDDAKARSIKIMLRDDRGVPQIAQAFGVSRTLIRQIRDGTKWAHVRV